MKKQITDPSEVLRLFESASNEKFYGVLTFQFHNGFLNLVRKEATIKCPGLDFSTNKIDER